MELQSETVILDRKILIRILDYILINRNMHERTE